MESDTSPTAILKALLGLDRPMEAELQACLQRFASSPFAPPKLHRNPSTGVVHLSLAAGPGVYLSKDSFDPLRLGAAFAMNGYEFGPPDGPFERYLLELPGKKVLLYGDSGAGRMRSLNIEYRPLLPVVIEVRFGPDGQPHCQSPVPELSAFLEHDLGRHDLQDFEDSMLVELMDGLVAFRRGYLKVLSNGGDLVCLRADSDGVLLEQMVPGSRRPGPRIGVDDLERAIFDWFDAVHPEVSARLRARRKR
ncbi:MAG: hypothetical protein U1E65_09525 [Myxococcota bacterium]